ncbi:MAG: hypothetical protein FD165_623 [Gammaproteobacteria bacterium]|nr:MAG: hypothetical protein FD165_623 [Gammaproteobacteria bacterium]TND02114.1 MAG: hypothetical protein FD120_2278 [Gammaproteobacteria bacterium]
MRIWDIDPGYLNRQSLLGEHRELHGIVAIVTKNKQGYARHPETLRWAGYGWALRQRHRLLAAEMALRGYTDKSPVRTRSNHGAWPQTYVDVPGRQFDILHGKYRTIEQGRIALPRNAQQLWAQHKYSVLARDTGAYRQLGRRLSARTSDRELERIARELTELLRTPPDPGGLRNALQHMWGYVADYYDGNVSNIDAWSSARLLREIRRLAMQEGVGYLTSSTALGELGVWVGRR